MNAFKFAFRQLLKNPGFIAVAVLTDASRLLPSKHAPDLSILQTDVNDNIPASAMNVVTGTVADSPANLARGGVLRRRDQAPFDFDAFVAGPRIGRGHRPSQRHSQFVFQDCFVQSLRHGAFRSDFRQYALGLAEFNDAARWRDTVQARRRNDKLARVASRLQVRVIADRPFVSVAWFLQIIPAGVRMRVKGSDDLRTLEPASTDH